MSTITLQAITKAYPDNILFEDLSFEIGAGSRLALVGPNGCGKSTLLKIIAGEINPDFGQVLRPREARLGYVSQDLSDGELDTVLQDFVLEVLPNWREFWVEWNQAVDARDEAAVTRLSHRQAELEHYYGYNPEHQAKAILHGLGFSDEKIGQPLGQLSGGWRERAKLARVLVAGADILFLDEPTNHLDLDAVRWLEDYLLSYQGTLVFVVHDRIFLDRVANKVLYLGGGRPVLRSGNYARFLQWQGERLDLARKRAARISEEIEQKQSFVNRFGSKATKATQAQSRVVQIEKLKKELASLPQEHVTRSLKFKWPEPARGNSTVLSVVDLDFSFPDGKTVFSGLNCNLYRGQKVALVGPNGQGKSTLLKLVMGLLKQTGGTITVGPAMKIGYFSQHQTEILDSGRTVMAEIRRLADPKMNEEELKGALGMFLLGQSHWEKLVADLSGGEKNRLVLASLFLARANFLILDEPTNHLDMESREALVSALEAFSGSLLFVAHDRLLLSRVAKEIWELGEGGLEQFPMGFGEYERGVEARTDPAAAEASAVIRVQRKDQKRQKRELAERRNRIYRKVKPLRQQYERLEGNLETAMENQAEVEMALSDPATYGDPERLRKLNLEFQRIQDLTEDLMSRMAHIEKEIQDIESEKDA
ncbi:MAG TPA: ATP-binding cassette domain-containing protein [Desulfomicrobiaceae bacterium]|nr:ATP-binding cassette domain-containing protein [Desulfomicrobiaceae bacterium]